MAKAAQKGDSLKDRLRALTSELMLIPGLSGYEGRVRRRLAAELDGLGIASRTDRLGNLIATLRGRQGRAERDALRAHGPARLRRAQDRGERACPRRAARRRAGEGAAVAGGALLRRRGPRRARRHRQQEPPRDDAGGEVPRPPLPRALRRRRLRAAPPRCSPPASISARRSSTRRRCWSLPATGIAGTSVDDRAGCAVMIEVARALKDATKRPTVHLVFSVQEEFNLRGALTAAQALRARHRHPARPDPRHRHARHDGARRRAARRRAGDEPLLASTAAAR